MNRNVRILVICIAAVAAIGLAFVVRALGSGEPVTPAAAAPAEAPKARVLVAAKDLTPGTRLTEGDMEWKDWPMDGLNPAYILDANGPQPPASAPAAEATEAKPENAVAAVARRATDLAGGGTRADFVGSVVREEIMKGEPIIPRKIVRAGDSGYMAAYLEPGMRAMAVKVSVESAAGGFILPGDRVDVVLTREVKAPATAREGGSGDTVHVSATVMHNLKVLAIDQTTRAGDDEQSVVGATATLEISARDAEILALAKADGELSLTLRSYADTAGPSGGNVTEHRVAEPNNVRIFRGGAPEVVTVP